MNSLLHKNLHITGRVQGVGFRYSARNAAHDCGIKGYVRNMSDGSVYIEAEGTEEQLGQFLAWCHSGPSRAVVKNIDLTEGGVVGFQEFLIR